MTDLVLMTGASGFLGRRLLRAWLRRTEARVVACVRERNGRTPAERLALVTNGHDAALHDAYKQRVTVLHADLAAPGLGLAASSRTELSESVTHVVHCGGVVRFDLPLDEVRRTNTEGTASMLDLAHRCPRLRRFDHISTAFVAGSRQGLVLESELDRGQQHNNSYERSKFEGELLVREAANELPIAVYRPSIITCDVRTGAVSPHGAVARMLRAYAAGVLTGLPGRADSQLDLVPADFVAEAVLALAGMESEIGGCFHLAAGRKRAATLGEVRDLTAEAFGRDELLLGAGTAVADGAPAGLRDEIALYAPYLAGGVDFDVTETSRALAETGIGVPTIREYFGRLAQEVARMVAHDLGARRPRP